MLIVVPKLMLMTIIICIDDDNNNNMYNNITNYNNLVGYSRWSHTWCSYNPFLLALIEAKTCGFHRAKKWAYLMQKRGHSKKQTFEIIKCCKMWQATHIRSRELMAAAVAIMLNKMCARCIHI